MPLFEVQYQTRLPREAGQGGHKGHHERKSDNKRIYPVGAVVNGDAIDPKTLGELVAKGTLAETTESMAEARRLSDAEALRKAAEEHRTKNRKGGVK